MISANFLDERLPERFWDKVQPCPMSGCWLWTGCTQKSGYGGFGVGRRRVLTHRYAYKRLVNGRLSKFKELDHLCKIKCCVNPTHLEPVSQREHFERTKGPFWARSVQTHCKNGHPLAGDNLYVGTNQNGRPSRICRQCRRAPNAVPRIMKLWEAAILVLRETGNPAVMWGDEHLLHMISERAGLRSARNGPKTSRQALCNLGRYPGELVHRYTQAAHGRWVSIFYLPEKAPKP